MTKSYPRPVVFVDVLCFIHDWRESEFGVPAEIRDYFPLHGQNGTVPLLSEWPRDRHVVSAQGPALQYRDVRAGRGGESRGVQQSPRYADTLINIDDGRQAC